MNWDAPRISGHPQALKKVSLSSICGFRHCFTVLFLSKLAKRSPSRRLRTSFYSESFEKTIGQCLLARFSITGFLAMNTYYHIFRSWMFSTQLTILRNSRRKKGFLYCKVKTDDVESNPQAIKTLPSASYTIWKRHICMVKPNLWRTTGQKVVKEKIPDIFMILYLENRIPSTSEPAGKRPEICATM